MAKKIAFNHDIDAELHKLFGTLCTELGGCKYEHLENMIKLYYVYTKLMPPPINFIVRDRTLDLDGMFNLLKRYIRENQ